MSENWLSDESKTRHLCDPSLTPNQDAWNQSVSLHISVHEYAILSKLSIFILSLDASEARTDKKSKSDRELCPLVRFNQNYRVI